MATYSTLLFETKNGICTITINREDKLNALNKQVLDDLDHAMDEVYADQNIKGIILTGKGEKSFVENNCRKGARTYFLKLKIAPSL